MKDLPLKSKGLLLVSVPLLFELVFVTILLLQLHHAELETQRETAAKNMIILSQSVLSDMYQVAVLLMRYRVSRDSQVANSCDEYLKKTSADLKELESNLAQQPAELGSFQSKRELILRQLKGMSYRRRVLGEGKPDPLSTEQKVTHYEEMSEVVEYFGELAERQRKLAAARAEAASDSRKLVVTVVAAGLVGNLILGVAGALLLSQWILGRVNVLSENALRLSRSETLIPQMPGKDEIAKLDAVFHLMATQLTDAIRREKAVIDNAPDLICSITRGGQFARVNPSVVSVLHKEAQDLVGTDCRSLFGEQFLEQDTNSNEWKFDSELLGEPEPMSVSWTVHWSDSEEQYYCVGRDNTVLRKLEKYKRELMDMVSHDLRTPLTSIRLSLELILEEALGPLSDPLRKRLSSTNANVSNLVNLVNELLDLYRSESGTLPLHKAPTNVAELIESVCDALMPLAEKRQIEICWSSPSEHVLADRGRVEQVLANLIANAIRYSPAGSRIDVVVAVNDTNFEFQVIDRGKGVPDEMKEAIFERFRQADPEDERDRKGTGLGLAIAKAIVEAHEGAIGVTSREGEGSTFWFKLPRAVQPSETLATS